ncbi:MAG: murein hydrolase activator EnvC family protein [Thermodesulfobacteriota bacterium]
MRHYASRAFCIILLAAAMMVPCRTRADSDDLRNEQIQKIEEKLLREREQYIRYDVKEKNLLGQLGEIEKQISEKREQLLSLNKKIHQKRTEMNEHQEELNRLEVEADEVRGRLAKRVAAYYKYARRGYVKLLATALDLDELRKRMYYLRIIMEKDRILLQSMLEVLRDYREKVQAVEERLQVVSRLEKEESEHLAAMEEDLDKKVFLLMRIHKEKEFYETAVKELESASQELKEKVATLDRKQERKTDLSSDFARRKGKLPVPFKGKMIENYHPLGTGPALTHRGVFIQGDSGGEVQAVYDGRIDYTGWLKGYGRIIIINHGSRYFSICAHLSEIRVEEGDVVRGGDVIGLAGESGSLSGPGLYFELRKAAESLDPTAWLKVR